MPPTGRLAPPAHAAGAGDPRITPHVVDARGWPALDGLRVLFMAWVLFYHLPATVLSPPFAHVRAHWTWGVTGFLALSGFLLARSLAPRGAAPLTRAMAWRRARDVLARRTARIVPGYWTMLLVVLVAPFVVGRSIGAELAAARGDLPAFAVFAGNYVIPGAVERLPLVLQTYWSLSFQEQFLAVMAIAFVLTGGRPARALLVGAIASAALRIGLAAGPWRDGFRYNELEGFFHLNVDAMAWGALAWLHYDRLGALWRGRRRAVLVSTALLLVLVASVTLRSVWSGNLSQAVLQALKYPALALLVRMACELDDRGSRLGAVLRLRAWQLPALASYEIYLVHALTYRVVMAAVPADGARYVVVALTCAVAAGMAMHVAWTRPAQRWLRARLGAGAVSRPGAAPVATVAPLA